jgi:hypothetical protein
MKKLLAFALMLFAAATQAQDNKKFISAMEKNLAAFKEAKTADDYIQSANAFERIASAEKEEWLPNYYASMSYLLAGSQQQDKLKMDEFYDKAMVLVDKAADISKENSEILALKAWVTSMKISVDPMTRGQELGMQSGMLTATAMNLDPSNPRPYMLKGIGTMYTPEQFGGGKGKALPILETALEKYKTFKPKNSIMPNWGEDKAREALEECKK